jgi:dihydroorotate dehydrogenase electron transfer subunit
MAPIIMLVNQIWHTGGSWQPLVLLESAVPFFFRPRPSRLLVPAMPAGVIATLPLLEDWGIPCRLASTLEVPGCYEGSALELASAWLEALAPEARTEVMLYAGVDSTSCRAIFHLAQTHFLPYQVIKADDGSYETDRL